jgi:hypothetical protein
MIGAVRWGVSLLQRRVQGLRFLALLVIMALAVQPVLALCCGAGFAVAGSSEQGSHLADCPSLAGATAQGSPVETLSAQGETSGGGAADHACQHSATVLCAKAAAAPPATSSFAAHADLQPDSASLLPTFVWLREPASPLSGSGRAATSPPHALGRLLLTTQRLRL